MTDVRPAPTSIDRSTPTAPPADQRPLTEAEAERHLRDVCFRTGPPELIGAELEWFLHDAGAPRTPLTRTRLAGALGSLAGLRLDAALTFEPGGQVELSSRPAASLDECVRRTTADLTAVRRRLAWRGLSLAGHGHDPWRPPRRLLTLPRYTAMEEYFDRFGRAGRRMMCSTASVQVCVDAGTDGPGPDGVAARWRLAHLLGPVLVAAFANSPLHAGRPTGWRSTRQAVWAELDPARTTAPPADPDPRAAWARYALDAPLLCVRREGGTWTAPPRLTFRDWIRGAPDPGMPPTLDALRYHLTTLFPPVRPQGHLELRMIDAQPGEDGWIVPLAVVTALFADTEAAAAAVRATERLTPGDGPAPRTPLWTRAARHGLADPALRRAAADCFGAARQALGRLGAPADVRSAVAAFSARYVARGRCPADDLLKAARTRGTRWDAGPGDPIGRE